MTKMEKCGLNTFLALSKRRLKYGGGEYEIIGQTINKPNPKKALKFERNCFVRYFEATQVPRVHILELTPEIFHHLYRHKYPVIIRGIASHWPALTWDRETIEDVAIEATGKEVENIVVPVLEAKDGVHFFKVRFRSIDSLILIIWLW